MATSETAARGGAAIVLASGWPAAAVARWASCSARCLHSEAFITLGYTPKKKVERKGYCMRSWSFFEPLRGLQQKLGEPKKPAKMFNPVG
jgi:hypothetical protein